MTIPPLSERRKKLAELRDRDGNALDPLKLAKQRLLTNPNANSQTVSKSVMAPTEDQHRLQQLDQIYEKVCAKLRSLLESGSTTGSKDSDLATAGLFEFAAEAFAGARPKLTKSARQHPELESELLACARKLRSKWR